MLDQSATKAEVEPLFRICLFRVRAQVRTHLSANKTVRTIFYLQSAQYIIRIKTFIFAPELVTAVLHLQRVNAFPFCRLAMFAAIAILLLKKKCDKIATDKQPQIVGRFYVTVVLITHDIACSTDLDNREVTFFAST